MELKEVIKEKVNRDSTGAIETDKEFFYIAGQCISFMCNRYVSINRALKKNLVSKQAMLSKNVEDLKKHLKMLFGKSNNMLYMEDKKFNNSVWFNYYTLIFYIQLYLLYYSQIAYRKYLNVL